MKRGARSRAAQLLASLAIAGSALARARADQPPAARDFVRVAYAASELEAGALEQTLASALRLPGLEHELRRVPLVDPQALLVPQHEQPAPLARIWVDLTGTERALVFVIDRSYAHVYIRELTRAANPALDQAQIGEIVHSAVQALQDGAVIGIARAELRVVPPPANAVGARSEPFDSGQARMRLGAGLLYGLGLRASGAALAQGPGLYGYALRDAQGLGLGGLLTAQYQPIRIAGANARASLDTLALRAGPLLEGRLDSRWALRASLGLGADLVWITPSAANASVVSDAGHFAAFALLEAALGVRARLSEHLELLASAAVEVELIDTRYVVRGPSGLVAVQDPFPVRPWLLIGVGFY
jgi:hypothetical protein